MTKQTRLPGLDPPQQVVPASDRGEPVVWVRRLRLVRDLQPGDEHVVRDVLLRRGLNIVWAPPSAAPDEMPLFRSGIAGHTAGKTLFCRLVRHALGEGGLAADATRRRIREKFPTGWLLAEILVDGKSWAVARPLGLGPHPFCIEGGCCEDLFAGGTRTEYRQFLEALERATTAGLPSRRFPTRAEEIQWPHLLPWVARDQECRFADFLEWRHPTSQSEAPDLKREERQFLVRAVLGLITDEERKEQELNAVLVAKKLSATREAPLLEHQASIDHQRLCRDLGLDLASPATDMFRSQVESALTKRRTDLERRSQEVEAADQRAPLRIALEDAVRVEALARRDVDEAAERVELQRATLAVMDGHARADEQRDLLARLRRPGGYCNVPLDMAREFECPLATAIPSTADAGQPNVATPEDVERQRAVLRSMEGMVRDRTEALHAARRMTRDARTRMDAVSRDHQAMRERLVEERAGLSELGKVAERARASLMESDRKAEDIKRMEAEIKESYQRQESLRRTIEVAQAKFGATFDYVVRALLGDDAEGAVEATGRDLALRAYHHGERDSAALATVRLLAFDLAALTQGIQGRGYFPRLLIHDGPREADLALDIYERLFAYARQLEACYGDEPGFQYIVTTTTAPPATLQDLPWLRLQLAGSPADARLLRVDL